MIRKAALPALYFFAIATLCIVFNACQSSTSMTFTGTPAVGLTLSGPLAGKTAMVLPSSVSLPNCWNDSAYWSGTTLYYAITSINYTLLSSNAPAYAPDPQCTLPVGQTTPGFNIYAATDQSGTWSLTRLSFNDSVHPYGAPKTSGNQMVFVSYEKTASNFGNIYFTTNQGNNVWSTPTAFPLNSSACNDDNPDIYANGTTIIFESNRSTAAATSCIANNQKLWTSTLQGGTWSTPVLLTGAPALGIQSFQPWLDESTGDLYWTADSTVCSNGASNCVLMAPPSNSPVGWSNTAQAVMTPAPLVPGSTTGKVVFAGEYSEANGSAFFVCGIATETDPTGNTPTLIQGRWTINLNVCVVPLN